MNSKKEKEEETTEEKKNTHKHPNTQTLKHTYIKFTSLV